MRVRNLLVSLIAALIVFGTVAFADDYDISLNPVEYQSGTGYVNVELVAASKVTSITTYATARVNYDKSVFELDTTNTTTMSPSTVVDKAGGYVQWSSQDGITNMTGGTLATIRFKVISGQEANVKGKEFYISQMVGNKDTGKTTTWTVAKNVKVAVTVVGGDDDTVKAEEQTSGSVKVTYPEGYTGDKNLDGKYIVFKNVVLQGTDVTANTRFNITYDGTTKTFGATLFETLGITGQGTLNAGTYGFGVAFDSDVNASDVTITTVSE